MAGHSKEDSPRSVLKRKRMERGSQRFVAGELNLAETYMRHIENGYADPSAVIMLKISMYFNESPFDLFPDLADQVKQSLKQ